MLYLLTLIILVSPFIIYGSKATCSKKNYRIYFIILFLISALNYGLGSDTFGFVGNDGGYYDIFNKISPLSHLSESDFDKATWQPGFVVLFSFFKTIYPNYLVYQIFHALIINVILFKFIRKNSTHVALCLFFYCMLNFFDYNFEIQRESFCIILGLVIFYMLERSDKLKTYIIAIIISIIAFLLLHRSAFILVLYPLLKKIKINEKWIIIGGIITLFIQVLWGKFSGIFSTIIDIVSGDIYKGYITREFSGGTSNIYFIRLAIINVIIPYICICFSYKSGKSKFLVFAMLSIAFECLADFTFAFHRMYGYFSPFYWIVLSDALIYITKKLRLSRIARCVIILCVSYYLVYTYHNVYFSYADANHQYVYERYFPYKSVLHPGNSY